MWKAQEWGGVYQRYKNINLNKIQRSDERASQDKDSLERHNDMNKLLNKKVFLVFFYCQGCLIQVLTLKQLQIYVNLIFVKLIFFHWWTALLHTCILESWWRGTARQTARQCNIIRKQDQQEKAALRSR